jgi:hypothetical protein
MAIYNSFFVSYSGTDFEINIFPKMVYVCSGLNFLHTEAVILIKSIKENSRSWQNLFDQKMYGATILPVELKKYIETLIKLKAFY